MINMEHGSIIEHRDDEASRIGMLNARVFPDAVGVAITTFLPCLALFMASD